ncbi:beta-galactosidase [Candidatus Neomarinimicrobiota bacterium]
MSTRMILAVILATFTLFSCTENEKAMSGGVAKDPKISQPDFFPVSAWYSGGKARAPMLSKITPTSRDEWRADLEQVKSLGFNTVRTWVDWQRIEAREGEYNFENLELLLELAQEVGLKVFIQVYTGWDGFGFAPDWVHRKFPDGFADEERVTQVASPPPTIFSADHKGIRDAALKFFTETAKVAVQYPNFYGWDLSSEPRSARLVSPATRERFRQYLKDKYGTLDELNEAWYETYSSWEHVQPQRTGGIGTNTMTVDWNRFISDRGAEDLRMMYEAVRKIDKDGVITSHASPSSILGGQLDDFDMAESVDYYGLSVYPIWTQSTNLWRSVLIGPDFSYSANKKNGGFYVGEFQAGFATVGGRIGDPVTPDHHRTWIWSLIASGAKAVNVYAYYVMSSGRESGGFGMINLDGTATERAIELGEIARFIDENKTLFLKSKPTDAEIALLYNPLPRRIGGRRSWESESGARVSNALIGYYRVFAENNIPVEYVHREELETGDVSRYKLMIVPYPIMITQAAARGLEKYIQQGGNVVAEARLAWNDDQGNTSLVMPGMGLSKVFGVRETKVVTRDEVLITTSTNSHPALAKIPKGTALKGTYYAESLEPLEGSEAEVLASLDDGTPGMVGSKYGTGKTLFVGSFLGLANNPATDENNTQFILGLLDWAGVVRPYKTSHDGQNPETPIAVRLQENSDGYLLFIINHGETDERLSVDLNVKADGEYTLREITQGQTTKLKSRNRTVSFVTDIAAKEVEVWDIK